MAIYSSTLTRNTTPLVLNGDRESTVTQYDKLKAGPRAILKLGRGDYRMWYEGLDGTPDASSQGLTQVCYATSTNGSTWTKQGIIIAPSPTGTAPTWQHNELSVGTVYWDSTAGVFKLWGHGGNNAPFQRQIYYATSSNGTNWTLGNNSSVIIPNGTAGTWKANGVADIHVLKFASNDYRAWYSGLDSSNVMTYGYATSNDGINWTDFSSNPIVTAATWGVSVLQSGCVVNIGGTFHLWAATQGEGVHYAHSQNGTDWTAVAGPRLSSGQAGSPDVNACGDTMWAFLDGTIIRVSYTGYDFGVTPTSRAIMEGTIKISPGRWGKAPTGVV